MTINDLLEQLTTLDAFVLRYDDCEWQFEPTDGDRIVGDDLQWVLERALDEHAPAIVVATALLGYAEGVQENLEDDWAGEHLATEPGDRPSPPDPFPVVEDYQADADRICAGEAPLHEHTREVLGELLEDDALLSGRPADLVRSLLAG